MQSEWCGLALGLDVMSSNTDNGSNKQNVLQKPEADICSRQ